MKRTILLENKYAELKNLNHSPEKNGDELVERVDLSLEFLCETDELDVILASSLNPVDQLFDKDGSPAFRELGQLVLSTKAEGRAYFGVDSEHREQFDLAVLKRIKVEAINGRRLVVTAQIRVDPHDRLDYLSGLRIKQKCVFTFNGSTDPDRAEDESQEKMDV